MHARNLPRTFSAGTPYIVLSWTPGRSRAIVRTTSELARFGDMLERYVMPDRRTPSATQLFAPAALQALQLAANRHM